MMIHLIILSIVEDDSSLCAGPDGELGGDPTRLQEELHEGERYKPLLRSKRRRGSLIIISMTENATSPCYVQSDEGEV